jgi:hypothetical protein
VKGCRSTPLRSGPARIENCFELERARSGRHSFSGAGRLDQRRRRKRQCPSKAVLPNLGRRREGFCRVSSSASSEKTFWPTEVSLPRGRFCGGCRVGGFPLAGPKFKLSASFIYTLGADVSGYFGFKLGLVQRSKGQSAVERSAYQRRGAARFGDGSVVDYSDRGDHIAHFVLAPEDAPAWASDCEQLWMRAAAAEKRANAQEARLIELSLPRALVRENWIELARRVGRLLVKKGMVVQVDIHCPLACDGLPNPHLHIMATMREIKDGKFAKTKARHWNKDFYRKAGAMRRDMAAVLNQYCHNRNIDYHADHRSNADRGLPRAEVHLPRWNFLHYKRTGKKTPALEGRDRELAARGQIARLEAECKEIERELDLARADTELAPLADVHSSKATKQQVSFPPPGNIAATRNRIVRPEKFSAAPALSVLTDSELPGPRYGP